MTPVEALDWVEKKMIPYYPLGNFVDRNVHLTVEGETV